MQKQLITIAILSLTLMSCQKEVPEMPTENLSSIAPPPIKFQASPGGPGGVVTLPVVVMTSHPIVNFAFGWESTGDFQAHNVTSTIASGGGNGAWQQSSTSWSSTPEVLTVIVIGTYTYIATGSFGADPVKEFVTVQIMYNKITGAKEAIISRTKNPTMLPR